MEGKPIKSEIEYSRRVFSPETIKEFSEYLNQGGLFIKQGNYSEAIGHFLNSKQLEMVGCILDIGSGRSMLLKNAPNPKQFEELSDFIAMNSKTDAQRMTLSRLHFYDFVPKENQVLPLELQHEISLVYMEEWLHVLQEIIQSPLVHGNPKIEQPEVEIDVAFYMANNGIPMTKSFLRRYDRGIALEMIK